MLILATIIPSFGLLFGTLAWPYSRVLSGVSGCWGIGATAGLTTPSTQVVAS